MPIKGIRRAELEDAAAIESLKNNVSDSFFGEGVEIVKIIEHSFLSLCLYDERQRVVAFMSLNTTPNVPAIPSWDWVPWIQNLYLIRNLTSRNTLFINLMVWKLEYCSEFIPIFLSTTFYSYLHIHNIILVGPPEIPDVFFIEEQFSRILPEGYRNASKVQTIFITLKQRFITRYKIRRAVEEDNDDIVPLIDDHACSLKDFYGEFYVAEIIQCLEDPQTQQNRERQFIVAESNGIAVGVLCLTSVIKYEALNQCFELRPFNGLKKPSPLDTGVANVSGLDDSQEDAFYFGVCFQNESKMSLEINTSEGPSKESATFLETLPSHDIPPDRLTESDDSADSFDFIDSLPSYHTDWNVEAQIPNCELINTDNKSTFSYILLSHETYSRESLGLSRRMTYSSQSESVSCDISQAALPQYFGEDNAFAIELFATNSEYERAITPDLIEASFECYPNREYCILTVPSTYPPCPLLQPFTKVPPRPYAAYPHELYVLHRSSLFGDLNVREGTFKDLLSIKNLLHGIRQEESIFVDVTQSIFNPTGPQRVYVLTVENSVAGCMVVREENDSDYIASHFILNEYVHLEHYPIGSFGSIIHAIISPIFQTHHRYFLREVHRLSDLPILLYCLYSLENNEKSLGNIVSEMIPVEPRLRPEYHPNLEKDGDVPREFVLQEGPQCALYVINLRHCSIPKMDVNYKIVIVGASSTGISFIENLVFGQTSTYLSFTNISLVSIHGFNMVKTASCARDLLFPFEGRYTHKHMRQMSLHFYVNLVTGVMTSINRKEKYIVVDRETILPYDFLFLTCGEQYYPPKASQTESGEIYPENLFIINTEIDGHNALVILKQLIEKLQDYNIVVYGATLNAYCCLTALLKIGIPGKCIDFVEPFPDAKVSDEVSLFNDGEVDDAVAEAIENEGIRVHTTYFFKSWDYNECTNRIQSVTFESKFKFLNLPCTAFFFYDRKNVSQANVSAIIRAGGLVYDGRLVINPMFQSNDPCIFAAGSMTKYSRRYYADHLSQKYFNHYEVGARLALYTKKTMDPTYQPERDSTSDPDLCKTLTPLFTRPIIKHCVLPGKLNYLSITKPGKPVSIEAQMNKEDYGRVLITGNVKNSKIGYFRLHLNHNNFVETITCLTKQPIDVQNMIKLWGKHERLLNKLVQRFEMFLIPDLYSYFRQPWAYALFHESFEEEVEKVNKLILNGLHPGYNACIISKIIDFLQKNEWQDLTPEQRAEIQQLYDNSSHKSKIVDNLLKFLSVYDAHLPVYAHPLKAKLLLQGFENSPLQFPQ